MARGLTAVLAAAAAGVPVAHAAPAPPPDEDAPRRIAALEARVAARAAALGLAPWQPAAIPAAPGPRTARERALGHVAAFLDARHEVRRSRIRGAAPRAAHGATVRAGVIRHCARLGLDRPPPPRGPHAGAARWRDIAGWLAARRELLRPVEEPLVRPAPGVRTSPFGARWGRMHEGIDTSAPSGTPIRAAAAGVVAAAGWSGGYGRSVVIRHGGGLSTAYAHLSAITTAPGRAVAQGDLIGRMGTTGHSTGVHLHFETRVHGRAVDPAPYLRGAPAAGDGAPGRRPGGR